MPFRGNLMKPRSNGFRYILRSRNGCKNSGKIWWMMKFHYREALTPVLLMKFSLEPTSTSSEDLGKHSVSYSFPWRPKLRDLSEDQNYKGPMQKTQWRSRTSSRKIWWLDNSRSQGSWWQLWISKQSQICSRGAGPSHPTDPVVSVQDKNFSGNRKELAKVLGAE